MAGRIVAGRLARLACQRHLDDRSQGHRRGLRWRPEAARFSSEFFRYLRHSKGEWAGAEIRLSPWQEFCTGSVFGWLRRDGLRRFRFVYEEVARKNGKSTLLSSAELRRLVSVYKLNLPVEDTPGT